jgi:hypothetical protein
VDEDRFPSARKDEVGLSGKVSAMQPVSIAKAMQEAANRQFGASITAAHAFHDA